MALTVEAANLVRQRTFADLKGRHIAQQLKAMWDHINVLNNPDLQFVAISGLETADKVVADVACKLYGLYLKKPAASTVSSWGKGSDHATVAAAAADVAVILVGTGGGGQEVLMSFPNGLKLATGLTVGAHTSVNGNSKSLVADAPVGWAIVGAA